MQVSSVTMVCVDNLVAKLMEPFAGRLGDAALEERERMQRLVRRERYNVIDELIGQASPLAAVLGLSGDCALVADVFSGGEGAAVANGRLRLDIRLVLVVLPIAFPVAIFVSGRGSGCQACVLAGVPTGKTSCNAT